VSDNGATGRTATSWPARIVTVPNVLSLSRMVMLPVILFLLFRHEGLAALAVMVVSWITDGLDGFLARRMHQVSDLGRVLDHVVDKVWVGSVLVTLVFIRGLPLALAAAVVLRDALILLGSTVIMRWRGHFVSSDVLGKITGFAFAVMIVYYTIDVPALEPARPVVNYSVGVLVVASFINYVTVFLRKMGRFRLPDEEQLR
jgi:cardiolipin synthase